jgi:hypothetical protein
MTCEKYKEALIEVAATGGNLAGRLDDHVGHCTQCSATLRRERMLFAAIDDVLRPRMNERPHAGFMANVRVEISKAALPKSRWNPMWALAGTALALALIAIAHPWARLRKEPVEAGGLEVSTIRAQQKTDFAQSEGGSTEDWDSRGRERQHRTKKFVGRQAASREPEVLVPPDERIAFAQFVAHLRRRDDVAQAFVSPAAVDVNSEPSKIQPIEIAGLQLKALVWEKWK